MISKLKKNIAKIPKIISALKSLVTGITVIFLIIYFAITLYKETKIERLTIDAFSVYPALAEKGYSGEVIARQIMDSYFNIYNHKLRIEVPKANNNIEPGSDGSLETKCLINKQLVKVIQPEWEQKNISYDVPSAGISLDKLRELSKYLFGSSEVKIFGEVVLDSSVYKLTARIDTQVINVKDSNLEALIQKTAEKIILATDPFELAVFHYLNEDYLQSKRVVDSVLKSNGKLNDEVLYSFHLLLGYIYDWIDNSKMAIDCFNYAIELCPDQSQAYLNKGIIQAKNFKQFENAFENIDKCLELDLLNWDAYYHKAIANLNYALSLSSKWIYSDSPINEDSILIIEKYFSKSIKHFDVFCENTSPNKIVLLGIEIYKMRMHFRLGEIYERTSRNQKKAIDEFKTVVKLGYDIERNFDSSFNLNDLSVYSFRFSRSLFKLSDAITADSSTIIENYDKAVKYLEKAKQVSFSEARGQRQQIEYELDSLKDKYKRAKEMDKRMRGVE